MSLKSTWLAHFCSRSFLEVFALVMVSLHRRLRRHQYMNNRRDRLAKQKHLHTCVGSALCFWANRLFAMSTLPLRTLRNMATLPRGGRCRVAASIRRFSARICFSRRTSTQRPPQPLRLVPLRIAIRLLLPHRYKQEREESTQKLSSASLRNIAG